MAQRSELFSIKNIILICLLMTILYGTYSYNSLKNRLNVSQANFLTMRSEAAQGTGQLKAALKARVSCMKDLKQVRATMWELKSKMSELETDISKQKHDADAKIIQLTKDAEICKTQSDSLQKELLKLKEEDRVKLAKDKENDEENEKKQRKISTEHDMAVSKLNDQIQDLKTENERLKVALAAARKHVKSEESPPANQPKHSRDEEPPVRQVQPPVKSKKEKVDNSSITPVRNVTAPETSAVSTDADKSEKKDIKKDEVLKADKSPTVTANTTTTTLNTGKKATEVPKESADTQKKSEVKKENTRSPKESASDSKNSETKLKEAVPEKTIDKPSKKAGADEKSKLDGGLAEDEDSLSGKKLKKDDKSLKFDSRPGDTLGDRGAAKIPLDDEKKEEKKEGKGLPRGKYAAALEKMKQLKPDKLNEPPQQQVDMPLPRHAAQQNKDAIQLPQPVQPAAEEPVKNKWQAKGRGAAGADDDDENAGIKVDY